MEQIEQKDSRSSNSHTINQFIKVIVFLLLLLMIFSISFTPLRTDNDVWWHLKTGKVIVENNYKLPENDIFAYTSENIEWHNHEWLSEVIFYLVYSFGETRGFGGIRTLILFKTLILILTGLVLFYLVLMRTKNFSVAIFATILAALLMKRTIYVRPPIFTYLFLSISLLILYNVKERRWRQKNLIIFPFLFILWANIHGGFLTGLVLIGAFWFESFVNFVRGRFFKVLEHSEEKNLFAPLSLTLFFSFLGSLITPYGITLYFLTARVMGDTRLVRSIGELLSPDFFFTWAFEGAIIFLIVGFSIIKKTIISLAEILLFIFFFHQAIQHVRHIPLFGIISIGVFGALLNEILNEINFSSRFKNAGNYLLLIFSVILIFFSVFHKREGESFIERNLHLFSDEESYVNNYPVEVADFILSNPFEGKMFNQINYAGYLIWRMSPEKHKIFTDSRFDIFGSKFIWDMMDIEAGVDYSSVGRNYEDLLNKYQINFVVVERGARLNYKLENNPDWKMVYFYLSTYAQSTDSGYSIFVRNVEENKKLVDSCQKCFKSIIRIKKRPYPSFLIEKVLGKSEKETGF